MADERPTAPCPHCGEAVTETQSVCPNCGALLQGVWPPPPASRHDGPVARVPEGAGAALFGFLLGLGIGVVWWAAGAQVVYGMSYSRPARPLILVDFLLFGLPAGAVGAAAFLLRQTRPGLARGMGYSAIVMLAAMLGAFTICH